VLSRVEQYDEPWRAGLEQWFGVPFLGLLNRLTLECVAWEAVIEQALDADNEQGRMPSAFYQECRG
jgi:hypothetical protein